MYRQILVTPPRDFLLKNIRENNSEYKNGDILIDKCVLNEVKDLWSKGIRTTGCCCGHNIPMFPSYIQVEKSDEDLMLELGYEKKINEFGAVLFTMKSKCNCNPVEYLKSNGMSEEKIEEFLNDRS